MKNKYLFCILLILSISLLGCTRTNINIQRVSEPQGSGMGRAVFAMTDAAADMGSVSSVKITIDGVRVHSAAEGWTTVSSSARTYDLIELKNENEVVLLADVQIEEGTYDQMRLDISNVIVTDANGQQEAKLPSGELKIMGSLVVEENSTSTATFDFIASESLHVTGQGKYIMAPVVQVETRQDADVGLKSNNRVEIDGGQIKTNVEVGMDINGNVGVGLGIVSNANLSLDTTGTIKIVGKGSGVSGVLG